MNPPMQTARNSLQLRAALHSYGSEHTDPTTAYLYAFKRVVVVGRRALSLSLSLYARAVTLMAGDYICGMPAAQPIITG